MQAVDEMMKMYQMFIEKDCTVLEINPFALDSQNKCMYMYMYMHMCTCTYIYMIVHYVSNLFQYIYAPYVNLQSPPLINPWRACAAGVTVVGLVSLSVCLSVC